LADEICSAGFGFGGGGDFFLQLVCPYLERNNYLSAAAFSGAVWKFAGKNSVRFTFGTAFNKSYLPVLYCAVFFVYGSVTCRILHGAVWFYWRSGQMIAWNIIYTLYLLCNIAILLFDSLSTLIFLPLLVGLWMAGAVWAIILLVKSFRKKNRNRYFAFIPLCCVFLAIILQFLPLPWHIWNAQITYLGNRNEWQKVIKNPAKENVISRSKLRTVIGFPHGESMLTRYENRIVYISDDALPQKEMFPMAENVTVYQKLAPNWYYLQVKY